MLCIKGPRPSKVWTLALLAAFILAPATSALAEDLCQKLLRVPRVTAPYHFPRNLDVVNLRVETEGFPVLKNKAELKQAFLELRDTPVVRLETLKVARRFPWPKFKTSDSGYARIPWGFSEEHCYLRAEMGAAVLADAGRPVPAAVSVVTDQSRIFRGTDENEEAPESLFPTLRPQAVLSVDRNHPGLIEHTDLSWSWHVSLAYVVDGELWLLDPALDYNQPIRFMDWHRRLAENVPHTQVEIGWPFALSDRHKAGQRLSLRQCFIGSPSEKLFGLEGLAGSGTIGNSPLSGVYKRLQEKMLGAYCSGEIDAERLEQLKSLFWQVAGVLEKEPGFKFVKD